MLGSNEFALGINQSMAVVQSKKLTSTEKRLQALRTQLYGKEVKSIPISVKPVDHQSVFNFPATSAHVANLSIDETNYLKKDLMKIFVLAIIILAIQMGLYFSINAKIINLL